MFTAFRLFIRSCIALIIIDNFIRSTIKSRQWNYRLLSNYSLTGGHMTLSEDLKQFAKNSSRTVTERSLVAWKSLYNPQRQTMYPRASSKDSDPRSLIRVFVVSMKKFCILCYPKGAHWKFLSECANANADLNLRWTHTSYGMFLMMRLNCWSEDSITKTRLYNFDPL